MRVRGISLNGGLAGCRTKAASSYEVAETYNSENSANNSWNVNFTSGNVNNNNKYNSNYVRAVAAFGLNWHDFLMGFYEAYEDCLRGKTTSPQAVAYMPEAEYDVFLLAWQVWWGYYTPSTSTCFMVVFPKLREVFAAHFRDRIVHHWICIRLLPLFERRCESLGNVSHACRKGFGNKTAIRQVEEGIVRVSAHMQKDAWIYRGDGVSFFMSIDKDVLWVLLRLLIEDEYEGIDKPVLLELTRIIVYHCPEKDCYIQSPLYFWEIFDPSKSLFFSKNGEPIGNLTTQLFAGYMMSFLDWFVVTEFRKHFGEDWQEHASYTRSVDDFTTICDDRAFLKYLIKATARFTHDFLKVECHMDKVYFQHVSHGVKFLGNVIKYQRAYTINRTRGRFMERVEQCIRECESSELTSMDLIRWQMVFNSYFGFFLNTRSYRIRKEVMNMLTPSFYKYFNIVNSKKVEIKNKYKYGRVA